MSEQDEKNRDLTGLVFHRDQDGVWVWVCAECRQMVHRAVNGQALHWVIDAQKEHVCEHVLAKKRLLVDRVKLRKVLHELGARIEILWTDYESAELMLVDKNTGAQLSLGSETLG